MNNSTIGLRLSSSSGFIRFLGDMSSEYCIDFFFYPYQPCTILGQVVTALVGIEGQPLFRISIAYLIPLLVQFSSLEIILIVISFGSWVFSCRKLTKKEAEDDPRPGKKEINKWVKNLLSKKLSTDQMSLLAR